MPTRMKPAELFPVLASDLADVDAVIRTRLRSEVALINTISDYIIGAGGKRMRPVMVLLTARALGYQGRDHHLLAAVVEFIHTATLLHDDVVDESSLRRGRDTANAAFGNAASVLVGDFLYSRAFQMMVETGRMQVMSVLADATNTIAEGEVLQLINCNDPDVDEDRYLQVIRYKTARLFEAAAQLGAILADAPPPVEEAAAAYGRHLGTAFQLIDDVLDYSGVTGDIGKNVGDDLREGKATLPLIHVLAHGIVKAALFMGVGLVMRGTGRHLIDRLGGLLHAMPVTAADGARNHRDVAPGPTPADGAATRVDGAASRIKAARVQTSRT